MRKKSNNGSRKRDVDMDVPPFTRAEMRRGMIGKYARGVPHRYVTLDRDVAKLFRDSKTVNQTLRLVARIKSLGSTKRKKSA